MNGIYGTFLDGEDVEARLLEFLREWMPQYVEEIREQKDPLESRWPKGVAAIRSYSVVHAADRKWPEDQLPMLLAYCPGLAAKPDAEGDGTMSGIYTCALTAIAAGANMEDSKALARLYATAAKGAIMQHEGLGGFAAGTAWLDEKNYPLTGYEDRERFLMAVSAVYAIEVPYLLNRNAGPLAPKPADEELHEVLTAEAEVGIESH